MKKETLEEFLARGGTIERVTLEDVAKRGQERVSFAWPRSAYTEGRVRRKPTGEFSRDDL